MGGWERLVRPPKKMDGFPLRPMRDFIYTAWLGQPNVSEGGIHLPQATEDHDSFGRYTLSEFRFGIVCAVGPGYFSLPMNAFLPQPDVELGDVVVFSRKVGTRVPGDYRFQPPGFPAPLMIRVIDASQCIGVVTEFKPWWDVADSQLDPSGLMTG
jgi:hypothetical protein